MAQTLCAQAAAAAVPATALFYVPGAPECPIRAISEDLRQLIAKTEVKGVTLRRLTDVETDDIGLLELLDTIGPEFSLDLGEIHVTLVRESGLPEGATVAFPVLTGPKNRPAEVVAKRTADLFGKLAWELDTHPLEDSNRHPGIRRVVVPMVIA